jgi:hypothetical protein
VTAPDERNPLARALDEVSDSPEARAFTIPVEAVRAGARRRRARRTVVTSGLAVLVVGAMAGGVYSGLPEGRGAAAIVPGPAESPRASAAVDWPAQFLRCGRRVSELLPDVGARMSLSLVDASSSIPATLPWDGSVTADVPTAAGDIAVVWGTELSVVSNGVVVGVQEGPVTPDLSLSPEQRLGDGGLPTSPFPVTTKVTRALASCDQYPSGQGSPDLPPGTYQLVVTQTLSYTPTPGVNPTLTDVRSSVTTSVTITAPAGPAGPAPASIASLTRCGAPADELAALAAAQGAPYTAALNPHSTPYGYTNIPASPVLTPVPGRTVAHDVVGVAHPVVVAIQGGTVVARSVITNHLDAWTGGLTITFPDPPALTRCPGAAMPADGGPGLQGDYELRFVVDVTVTGVEPGTRPIASPPIP